MRIEEVLTLRVKDQSREQAQIQDSNDKDQVISSLKNKLSNQNLDLQEYLMNMKNLNLEKKEAE